ncbi:MAG: hypothetical protein BMS9Abin17_1441 [Acidimicrobiia bacterium]|nr:MAG: hypothetical protein BMS9Abin17_1441 [Acidimicrobiia bacterium]
MSIELVTPRPDTGLAPIVDRWRTDKLMDRVWQGDPTVWGPPGTPEITNRLGWLGLPQTSLPLIPVINDLAGEAIASGITDIVLCGMGGSSLAPEVFAKTLAGDPPNPTLTVLDSTHPDAIRAVARSTVPERTWYIIASKSGTTLETLSLFRFFWAEATDDLAEPGSHFIAITDPGSSLVGLATERGFRASIEADPNVGGRYSALAAYGLVPAGLVGADVRRILESASEAARQCAPVVPLLDNPAFVIGATLASRALNGTDKVQIVATPPVSAFPVWAEQLIAESTGKEGLGILPIAGGPAPSAASDGTVVSIGSSVYEDADLSLLVDDGYDIAGAMFVLELATAAAGEILGIQPFDQPDVQLAKLLAASAMSGELETTSVAPMIVGSPELATALGDALGDPQLSYISVQAYVKPDEATDAAIEALRTVLDTRFETYTTSGYGPRFLHSTGQLHKGGPPGGLFIQIIDEPEVHIDVPETDFSFNELIAAQAQGDRAALEDRGRTVVTISAGDKVVATLEQLTEQLMGRSS